MFSWILVFFAPVVPFEIATVGADHQVTLDVDRTPSALCPWNRNDHHSHTVDNQPFNITL
jgi:hypothetical protein